MPTAGHYTAVLSHLGTLLRAESAQSLQLTDEGLFWTVRWQAAGRVQERSFPSAELALPAPPESASRPDLGGRTACLAGLGRQLDVAAIEVSSITEGPDGFLVRGTSHGRYVTRRYSAADLRRALPPDRTLTNQAGAQGGAGPGRVGPGGGSTAALLRARLQRLAQAAGRESPR